MKGATFCGWLRDQIFVGFQSTHLLRGATCSVILLHPLYDVSIHAPLARCDIRHPVFLDPLVVSIHAPLARCDLSDISACLVSHVSIHAPLARCDSWCRDHNSSLMCFNPRTSCEVRPGTSHTRSCTRCFNPRTSCEVRLDLWYQEPVGNYVSIHAPLARCDLRYAYIGLKPDRFQSTHLLRGATHDAYKYHKAMDVSIHAPLARCDFRVRRIAMD